MTSATIVQLYAFGTIGHKFAKSFENDRLPNQIIATVGLRPALQRDQSERLQHRFEHGERPDGRLHGGLSDRHRQRLQRRARHAGSRA